MNLNRRLQKKQNLQRMNVAKGRTEGKDCKNFKEC